MSPHEGFDGGAYEPDPKRNRPTSLAYALGALVGAVILATALVLALGLLRHAVAWAFG